MSKLEDSNRAIHLHTVRDNKLIQVPRRQRERAAEAPPHTRAGRQEDISPLVARDCLASDHLAEEFVSSSALFGLIPIEVL